jgi:hypothetical protein
MQTTAPTTAAGQRFVRWLLGLQHAEQQQAESTDAGIEAQRSADAYADESAKGCCRVSMHDTHMH